jgi:hypothetical protein
MLPLVEALLQASPKVKSFQIIDNDPVDEGNFLTFPTITMTHRETSRNPR